MDDNDLTPDPRKQHAPRASAPYRPTIEARTLIHLARELDRARGRRDVEGYIECSPDERRKRLRRLWRRAVA